ncbi:MAG: DEAD/DEAH box helicase [Microscillaceae bacterium]|jgi:SNF2 family DNA or RNA helicase|nr:DEAD/DEAH box helicase [Microscillaceae bacterium]
MKVATTQPFQIVYSILQHEFLGYLFEPFVVQINSRGELTYQHQSVSPKNAREFAKGLDEADFQLINLIETIQQDYIIKKFYNKKVKPAEFFLKVYNKEKGDLVLQEAIERALEDRRQQILQLLRHKSVFIMGKDGNPTWKALQWAIEPLQVTFYLHRNPDNIHYYPSLYYQNQKLDFQQKDGFVLANKPAFLVIGHTIYWLENEVDGMKIKPFFFKKFLEIPRKIEGEYYRKFLAPLISHVKVKTYGDGLAIEQHDSEPVPVLSFSEHFVDHPSLFENAPSGDYQIQFELNFCYQDYIFRAEDFSDKNGFKFKNEVRIEETGEGFIFHKIKRHIPQEKTILKYLHNAGLELKKGRAILSKSAAIAWLTRQNGSLTKQGIQLKQNTQTEKKYFLGKAEIDLRIEENHDWFDINARIRFGEYEIPFLHLRKLILQKKTEFTLPNGEIAIIPEVWLSQYAELFALAHTTDEGKPQLKKYHLSLVEELRTGNYAQVTLNRKLEKFRDFQEIGEYALPKNFKGELRPYQKAGYNWLRFLRDYRFGGCLADDMGLGKTIMTLALLQSQKEMGKNPASLLVIPTSLIYNWELEAQKFTPDLKVFVYTGTNRKKNIDYFDKYDLIITSYGIVRLDTDILKDYLFSYVILDESQAIKNPTSNISQAVKELQSQFKLILTGTPLENTTLDLWSQISFINPGLLGSQTFFKEEYLYPIEKKQDTDKIVKLGKIIKPFVMRRLKSQVATDLPEKIENVQYCLMSKAQEEYYEKVKSEYRNEILKQIESEGIAKSQILLLQGLTKLRQIANHPQMIDNQYVMDSGKLEDILYKLESVISENHKVLIFSQFVKHLNILKTEIEKRHWQYAYLDGSTNDRQAEVEKFQKNKDISIFLISLKAGGVGLNLTAAEYVFLLDPWWNPAIEAQAIDRAHRIGQKNTVFTYKFISKNTVEEKILRLQQNKRQLAANIISTEESFMKNLTKEDVLALLD